MGTSDSFPETLRAFVAGAKWTFAKTMPKWPHEYIVRDRVDEALFVQMVRHIRANAPAGSRDGRMQVRPGREGNGSGRRLDLLGGAICRGLPGGRGHFGGRVAVSRRIVRRGTARVPVPQAGVISGSCPREVRQELQYPHRVTARRSDPDHQASTLEASAGRHSTPLCWSRPRGRRFPLR